MVRLDATRFVYVASVAFHVVAGLGLSALDVPKEDVVEVFEMQTVELPKPPKPKPPEPPPEVEQPAASPRPKAAPPPPSAPAAAPEAPPDFGFALGAADGPGGIAVAAAAVVAPPTPRQVVRKAMVAPKVAPEDGCSDAEVKAKAVSMPHPAYTDAARTAGIEGKVRVELSVDETGAVTGAKVLEGLGSGLDEAALDAVRGARFSPATRCGEPVASTFTVSIRFTL